MNPPYRLRSSKGLSAREVFRTFENRPVDAEHETMFSGGFEEVDSHTFP